MVNIGILVQDMAKVSFHFVRGGQTEKFATTLVNFMGKVSLFLYFFLPFFFFQFDICVENLKEIILKWNHEEHFCSF